MRYIIRNIHVWSVMKTTFLFFFVFGILLDILYIAVFGIKSLDLFGFFERSSSTMLSLYFLFSLAVSFGVFMSVVSGIASTIYNLSSDFFGGIRVCLRAEDVLDSGYLRELSLSECEETDLKPEDLGKKDGCD